MSDYTGPERRSQSVSREDVQADIHRVEEKVDKITNDRLSCKEDMAVMRQQIRSTCDTVERHTQAIYGNGKVGLNTVVSVLTEKIEELTNKIETKRNLDRTLLVGVVFLILERIWALI